MNELKLIVDVAAKFMPRDRAEELCKNLVMVLPLCGDGTTLDVFEYVYSQIRRREKYFGLKLNEGTPGDAAGAIVRAWEKK